MWIKTVLPMLTAVVAILVVQLRQPKTRTTIQFKGGAKYPAPQCSTTTSDANIITNAEKKAYHRDGFILKKSLLQGEELADLVAASEEYYKKTQKKINPFFKELSFDLWTKNEKFAQLVFESQMPCLSAKLLGMNFTSGKQKGKDEPPRQSVRILRDGFFGFQSKNNSGCGFHVDDRFFWPAADDSSGVNFWIALSPIRILEGGGIRVVNQTLVEPIFEECRQVIREFDPKKNLYPPTCEMEKISPVCHKKMLEASTVFDMEPGDTLIWDRWTFHRTEPFHNQEGESAKDEKVGAQHKLRYTIRYIPGTAKASAPVHEPQGIGEPFNTPYYPQVWPKAIKSEIKAIRRGLVSSF